jgi:hypothetical protein
MRFHPSVSATWPSAFEDELDIVKEATMDESVDDNHVDLPSPSTPHRPSVLPTPQGLMFHETSPTRGFMFHVHVFGLGWASAPSLRRLRGGMGVSP